MPVRTLALPLAVLALLTSACGGSPEDDVRDRLDEFAQAVAAKDYQRLCDDLFSQKLIEEVRKTVPCEVALRNSSLGDARNPKLEIERVQVEDDTATAVVRTTAANQPPSEDTVRLVREDGEWRIIALAS